MCPAAHELPNGAKWRCNLHPGHVGPHDDGVGDPWHDDISTPGPGRLQVAAASLLGSRQAWAELRPALELAVGADGVDGAIHAMHAVLVGWAEGTP